MSNTLLTPDEFIKDLMDSLNIHSSEAQNVYGWSEEEKSKFEKMCLLSFAGQMNQWPEEWIDEGMNEINQPE